MMLKFAKSGLDLISISRITTGKKCFGALTIYITDIVENCQPYAEI